MAAFLGQTSHGLRLKDISENQKKLYAHNMKSDGGDIKIYDINKPF